MRKAMLEYIEQCVNSVVFGDIFLEDLRDYRENKLALVEYWNPRFHGVGCNENMIRYFHIMEKLNFITHIFSCDINSLLFNNINNTINEENAILGFNRGLKLMILRGNQWCEGLHLFF